MRADAGAEVTTTRFNTVVFDVDSTLTGVEGIDWLASLRDAATRESVRQITDDAMSGRLALEEVYARRLELVAPTRAEVRALAAEYLARVARGAREAIGRLRSAGVRVVAVSGGLREAVAPFCAELSFSEHDVFAVAARWNEDGRYAGFDRSSPLATQHGKAVILGGLGPPRPILMVGDGSTDSHTKAAGAADAFAAYVGFVRRVAVIAGADYVLESFEDLAAIVLAGSQ